MAATLQPAKCLYTCLYLGSEARSLGLRVASLGDVRHREFEFVGGACELLGSNIVLLELRGKEC